METKLALSITDFCRAHSISRATFYNLLKEGRAPHTMRVGRRRFVSAEAAADWRRRMERPQPDAPR
jgi:predicted DNA-binding transcriptional regulator AlpA